ncbi:GNAT family N-acetyltransferase [Shewanella salipaludis]|uniref:Protein ElaA n=1 Tax=Shewanella salipaludis TaxID=2723052 RepID=A0A972G225_9GAMM|nr:GNAT family N-acetyltransferase [Shewanella salipaludis]NMH66902.1 GNAT family N-acetyltransferase [Shewanella salipaludis]
MLQWHSLRFDELTRDQLYELLKLRVDVFVVEQACPYPELDDKDRHPQTLHLLGVDAAGQLLAYARLLAPGLSYPQASIGRVAVAKAGRGSGLALALMQQAITLTQAAWPQQGIQIGAQDYLRHFYQKLGFMPHSQVYLEDGIPHLDMLFEEIQSSQT